MFKMFGRTYRLMDPAPADGGAGNPGGGTAGGTGGGGDAKGAGDTGGDKGGGGKAGDPPPDGDSSKGAPAGGGTDGSPKAAKEVPENWRELYAGTDEKKLGQLKRYKSFNDAMDGLFEAKQRIARGEVSKVLGDKPTEEEIKEYRKANNIPDDFKTYKLELSDGRKIEEHHQPAVEKMLERLHKIHASPRVASEAVNALFDLQEMESEEQNQADQQAINDFNATLRPEWGSDYGRNVKILKTFAETLPGNLGKQILSARLPDGTPFGSSPDVARWLLGMALESNPLHTVVDGGTPSSLDMVNDELSKLTKLAGDHSSEYWKGPKAETMQARMRALIDAKQRAEAKR